MLLTLVKAECVARIYPSPSSDKVIPHIDYSGRAGKQHGGEGGVGAGGGEMYIEGNMFEPIMSTAHVVIIYLEPYTYIYPENSFPKARIVHTLALTRPASRDMNIFRVGSGRYQAPYPRKSSVSDGTSTYLASQPPLDGL